MGEVRVLLFDGMDSDQTFGRADRRLSFFQAGKSSRIGHILNREGRPVGSASSFIECVKSEFLQKVPLLLFVHTSAITPQTLADQVREWDLEGCRVACFALFSGGGVDPLIVAPLLQEDVADRFARVAYIKMGIDTISEAGKFSALIDYFHAKAYCLISDDASRRLFLEDFDRFVKRINNPFRPVLTSLHIAISVYLAARGLNPSTGRVDFYDLGRPSSNLLRDLQKAENWRPFLSGFDLDELREALNSDGFECGPEWRGLESFLKSDGLIPEDSDLIEMWKALDEELRKR